MRGRTASESAEELGGIKSDSKSHIEELFFILRSPEYIFRLFKGE